MARPDMNDLTELIAALSYDKIAEREAFLDLADIDQRRMKVANEFKAAKAQVETTQLLLSAVIGRMTDAVCGCEASDAAR